MDTPRTKVDKDHPLNPGMIEVNLLPPPKPASEPNDIEDDPAPSITNAAPTNDEDLEANPKINSNPKIITKDPLDTSDHPLPAPSSSKDAPQHIKDPIFDASPTLPTPPNSSLSLTM